MESGAKPRKVPEVREGEIAQSRLFLRSFGRGVACGVSFTPATCCCLGCWEGGTQTQRVRSGSPPALVKAGASMSLSPANVLVELLNTGLRLDWNLR